MLMVLSYTAWLLFGPAAEPARHVASSDQAQPLDNLGERHRHLSLSVVVLNG